MAAFVPSAMATPFTTMMLTYRGNMTTAKVSCGCFYDFAKRGERVVIQGARMRCRDHGLQTVVFAERSFKWCFPRPEPRNGWRSGLMAEAIRCQFRTFTDNSNEFRECERTDVEVMAVGDGDVRLCPAHRSWAAALGKTRL